MAQHWANHLAHANAFMYKPGETGVGQNLYCRLPNTVATEVTGEWLEMMGIACTRREIRHTGPAGLARPCTALHRPA